MKSNTKNNFFNNINIIDAAVVIVFFIILSGIFVRFFYGKSNFGSKAIKIEYKLEVQDVCENKLNALKKSKIFYDSDTNEKIGQVNFVQETSLFGTGVLDDGTIIEATVPDKYKVIVGLELMCWPWENGYIAKSGKFLEVGADFDAKTKYCQTRVKIIDITT